MELLKKILPVATIASAAAIVAPITTSCASILVPYEYKTSDIKAWTPSLPQRTTKDVNVTYDYLNDIKNNKQILADDLMFYLKNSLTMDLLESKVKMTTISIGNIQPETGKMTFTINYEFLPDIDIPPRSTISLGIYNFPYIACKNGNHWGLTPFAFWQFPKEEGTDYQFQRAIYLIGIRGWSLHLTYHEEHNDISWSVSANDNVLVIEHVLDYCSEYIDFSSKQSEMGGLGYLYHIDGLN